MTSRLLKRLISGALALTLVFSINGFAAVVTDSDGSAFITKAEFDSLKNSFQAQIDSYNQAIDSKIDGAIAAYLAGIQLATTQNISIPLNSLLENHKNLVARDFNKYDSDVGRNNQFSFSLSFVKTSGNAGDITADGELQQFADLTKMNYLSAQANAGTQAGDPTPRIVLGSDNMIKAWESNKIVLNYTAVCGFRYTVTNSGAYWYAYVSPDEILEREFTSVTFAGWGNTNAEFKNSVLENEQQDPETHIWSASICKPSGTTFNYGCPSYTLQAIIGAMSPMSAYYYYWKIDHGNFIQDDNREFNYVVQDLNESKVYKVAPSSYMAAKATDLKKFFQIKDKTVLPTDCVWCISNLYDYKTAPDDYKKLGNLRYGDIQSILPWNGASLGSPIPLWVQTIDQEMDFEFSMAIDNGSNPGYLSMFYMKKNGEIEKLELEDHELNMPNVKRVDSKVNTHIRGTLPAKCFPLIAWTDTAWNNNGIKLHYIDQAAHGVIQS